MGKGKQREHDYLYWEFHESGGKIAVRKDNWKAITLNVLDPERRVTELYNLSEDLHEDNNVASLYPEIVRDLEQIMNEAHVDSDVFTFTSPTIIK